MLGLGALSTLLTNADPAGTLDIEASAAEVRSRVVRVTFNLQNVKSDKALSMKIGGSIGNGGDQEASATLANQRIQEGMKELMAGAFDGRSLALSVAGNEVVGTLSQSLIPLSTRS